MNRYIDADALIKRWNEMTIRGRTEFDQEIMLAPTIDAVPIEHINLMNLVEVVRCKECKWLRYCETEDLDLYLDCDKPDGGGIPRSEDWFCADGEREGE